MLILIQGAKSLLSFKKTRILWGEWRDYVDVGKIRGKCWCRSFPYSPPKWSIHCGENVGTQLMWAKPGENGATDLFLILLQNDLSIGENVGLWWYGQNLGKMVMQVFSLVPTMNLWSIKKMWDWRENVDIVFVLIWIYWFIDNLLWLRKYVGKIFICWQNVGTVC